MTCQKVRDCSLIIHTYRVSYWKLPLRMAHHRIFRTHEWVSLYSYIRSKRTTASKAHPMYFTIVTTGSRQLVEATRPSRSLDKLVTLYLPYNTTSFSSLAIGLPSRRDLVLSLDSSERNRFLATGIRLETRCLLGTSRNTTVKSI